MEHRAKGLYKVLRLNALEASALPQPLAFFMARMIPGG
jgi:hypothetical protein